MPVIACPDCGRDVSPLAPACPHCGRPSPGGTTPMPAASPAALQEETLWRGTPSPKVLVGRAAGLLLIVIGIPLLAHALTLQAPDLDSAARIARIGWFFTAIVALVQLVRLAIALVRIRSTLYTITNQRVMVERGIVTKAVSEIDLRYIDDSQFFQSLTGRILGIGNVTLISSDKSTPTYVLEGVADPRRLRELIRAHAYQASQRQIFTRQA
jgi:hypothetical protein